MPDSFKNFYSFSCFFKKVLVFSLLFRYNQYVSGELWLVVVSFPLFPHSFPLKRKGKLFETFFLIAVYFFDKSNKTIQKTRFYSRHFQESAFYQNKNAGYIFHRFPNTAFCRCVKQSDMRNITVIFFSGSKQWRNGKSLTFQARRKFFHFRKAP